MIFGSRFIELLPGDEIFLMELLETSQISLRELQVCLGLLDLRLNGFLRRGLHLLYPGFCGFQVGLGLADGGFRFPDIQRNQNLSFFYPVPFPDVDVLNPTLDFGVNGNLGVGDDVAGAQNPLLDQPLGGLRHIHQRNLTHPGFFLFLFGRNDLGRPEGSKPDKS